MLTAIRQVIHSIVQQALATHRLPAAQTVINHRRRVSHFTRIIARVVADGRNVTVQYLESSILHINVNINIDATMRR